jgi:hypothetical protein
MSEPLPNIVTDPTDDYQRRARTRTSGLAIACLVLSLLTPCLTIFAMIPAIILGIIALVSINRSQGELRGTGIAIAGLVISCLALCAGPLFLLPAVNAVREAARRNLSTNYMREMALALDSHLNSHRRYPAVGVDERGVGPERSWRVELLPFMEEARLHDSYRRDEPWDSDHNQTLIDQMPPAYVNPNGGIDPGKTNYLAVTGPQTVFPGGKMGPDQDGIRDGLSNTVLLVEADADQAAIWTSPEDWRFDPNNPRRGLGGYRHAGFLVLFADRHVRFIPNSIDDETLSALMTAAGGEAVELDMGPP